MEYPAGETMSPVDVNSGSQFWTSLVDVTFEHHFWPSLWTTRLEVTVGGHFWTSLLNIFFERDFLTSLLDISFGCHFWTSLLDITFACQFWMSDQISCKETTVEEEHKKQGDCTFPHFPTYRLNRPRCQFSENIRSHIMNSPGVAGAALQTPSLKIE